VIALTDHATGALAAANTYDEFGKPGAANSGTFGYTGRAWLPELGLHYYKARVYDPELGRFLQTDPIGYEDSPNLYAYVLNDPVNLSDPLGLSRLPSEADAIVITAHFNLRWKIGALEDMIRPPRRASTEPGGGSPGHDFGTENEVCARPLTTKEMKELLSKFAVPGHADQSLTTGTYLVSARFGSPGPGGRTFPGGWIRTTFSEGGRRVTNVARDLHVFGGQARRDIHLQGGRTVITTRGTGTAQIDNLVGWDPIGQLRDAINQKIGPSIFNALDAGAAAYAQSKFEGC